MEEQDQRAGSQSGLKTNIKFTTKHRTIEDLTLNPDCHSGSDYDENLNVMKFAELNEWPLSHCNDAYNAIQVFLCDLSDVYC